MGKMFKIKTGFLFLLNTLLIVSVRIVVFPEFFAFPWLVAKGLFPYRDFFDHHGPLTYYLLAPFSLDKSFFLTKCVYFLLQTLTLFLFLKIIRRQKHYFFLGLLFVLVNFFMAENVLWFENFTTIFYLLIYFLSLKKPFRFQNILLTILIWLSSLIKPHASLILLPVFLLTKNWRIILYFSGLWFLTIGYFFIQKALPFVVDNLIYFNLFCSRYSSQQPIILYDIGFLKFSLLLLAFCLVTNTVNKKLKQNLFLLSFIVIAFLFFFPGYSKTHTSVIIPFFLIFIGKTWEINDRFLKPILLFLVIVYFFYVIRLNFYHVQYLKKQPQENYGKIQELYLEDKLPQTRYILPFPWVKEYYHLP